MKREGHGKKRMASSCGWCRRRTLPLILLLLLLIKGATATVITHRDCPVSSPPLQLTLASNDVVLITNCTVGHLLIANLVNCSVSIRNATFLTFDSEWASITLDGDVSGVNVSVLDSSVGNVAASFRLLNIGASYVQPNSTCAVNLSHVTVLFDRLSVNGSTREANFSVVGFGTFNSSVTPYADKVLITDTSFVFSRCSMESAATAFALAAARIHHLATLVMTRVVFTLLESNIDARYSNTALFTLAATQPTPAVSLAASFLDVLFLVVRLTGSIAGLVSFGALGPPEPILPSFLMWGYSLSNVSVVMTKTSIEHSIHLVSIIGVDVTMKDPKMVTAIGNVTVQITNGTLLRRVGAGGASCFSASYVPNVSSIMLSVTGRSILNGCRAADLTFVYGGLVLIAIQENSSVMTFPNSVSNACFNFFNTSLLDVALSFTNSTVSADFSLAPGAAVIYFKDSRISKVSFVAEGSNLSGKVVLATWVVTASRCTVCLVRCSLNTTLEALALIRANFTDSSSRLILCTAGVGPQAVAVFFVSSSQFSAAVVEILASTILYGNSVISVFGETLLENVSIAISRCSCTTAKFLLEIRSCRVNSLVEISVSNNSIIESDTAVLLTVPAPLELSSTVTLNIFNSTLTSTQGIIVDSLASFHVIASNTTFDCSYPLLFQQGGVAATVVLLGCTTTNATQYAIYFFS